MNDIAQTNDIPDWFKQQGCSATFIKRFWSNVLKTEGCWIWLASKSEGYGQLPKGPHGAGYIRTHVISWVIHYGPPPEGQCVLHKCDVRECVRPDHLWIGNRADNLHDAKKKGRNAFGEKHGRRKLTESEAKEIYQRFKRGHRWACHGNADDLAAEFGVNVGTIYSIMRMDTWRHLHSISGP